MSEDYLLRHEYHEDLISIKQDIKDIKDTVHNLVQSKQDKIRPSIFAAVFVYMISQVFLGVWWAAGMSEEIDRLVENQSYNYDMKDGQNLKNYVDLRDTNIELSHRNLELRVQQITDDIEKYKEKCESLINGSR